MTINEMRSIVHAPYSTGSNISLFTKSSLSLIKLNGLAWRKILHYLSRQSASRLVLFYFLY